MEISLVHAGANSSKIETVHFGYGLPVRGLESTTPCIFALWFDRAKPSFFSLAYMLEGLYLNKFVTSAYGLNYSKESIS